MDIHFIESKQKPDDLELQLTIFNAKINYIFYINMKISPFYSPFFNEGIFIYI
jgi:hypothetical protein